MQYACALYCHLSPVSLYCIFPPHFINRTILEQKLLHTKCVFWFPLPLLSESLNSKNRSARCYHKCTSVFMYSAVILVRFYRILNFLDRFSENNQKSNFTKIRPLGAELFLRTDRWTDGRKKPIVAFRNFANKPRNALSAESGIF
jgi:hypothetical protein